MPAKRIAAMGRSYEDSGGRHSSPFSLAGKVALC
jgi:hypothetical protein